MGGTERRVRMLAAYAPLAVLFCMIAMLAGVGFTRFYSSAPPHVVLEHYALNSVIRAGEPLLVHTIASRTRNCPTSTARHVLNEDGVQLLAQIAPALITGIGPRLESTVAIEVNIPPGHYILHTDVVSDCGDHSFIAGSPDIPFEVIP